ncbi:MAG TPA: AAA family ATPase [Polyangiaceae bacterium]|nr:AAA family ATPase [Polyangiaceae bacterium]
MTRGLVLGKFLPPHAGHLYLLEFAQNFCSELTVVVGTLESEPIPGPLRFEWMRELCPRAQVLHLADENPQSPEEHPEFWAIWRGSLQRILPQPPDLVFASERYGERLAHELEAGFVVVDPARTALPVSGSAIRERPLAHFAFLPPCVRAHYALRISIFGPESTGKSTLSAQLAEHYQTQWVPEYARAFLEHRAGDLRDEDMATIARGQACAEDALARSANRILFCDTDPLATQLWSDALFSQVPDVVVQAAAGRSYDLTLLLEPDVPWVADPVRYLPEQRDGFFSACRRALQRADRRVVTLRGNFEQRFVAARAAVDALLEEKQA